MKLMSKKCTSHKLLLKVSLMNWQDRKNINFPLYNTIDQAARL